MPPRAVLFDFDGVLADTANVHIAAWQRTFRAVGWNEPEEACARAVAGADAAFVREVFARRQVDGGDAEGWARRKQELTIRLLRDRPYLCAGAAEVVQGLREAGAALAVATAAPRAHVEAVLAATGLLDAFDPIVAAEAEADPAGVGAGAAGRAAALARLGVAPGEAVFLGSGPAAGPAGLRVVVVAPARPAGDPPWLPGLDDPAAVLAALGF